jgi:hypothetical protein
MSTAASPGDARYRSALRAWAKRKAREQHPDGIIEILRFDVEMSGGYGSSDDVSYESPQVEVWLNYTIDGKPYVDAVASGTYGLADFLNELLSPQEPTDG